MLGGKRSIPRLWRAAINAEALCTGAMQSSAWEMTCSLLPCTQGLSSRSFANGADLQNPNSLPEQVKDYAVLREFLSRNHRGSSSLGARESPSGELPIGGGVMPEIPKIETPTTRLLGRKGHERLTALRKEAQPGNVGSLVTAAIQELEAAPRRVIRGSKGALGELEDLMDRWDELIRQKDTASLSQQMKARPRDVNLILSALDEAEEKAAQAAEKEMRRQREEDIKAAHAAKRVRTVDNLGRAYGTGKRKTSIARVWIKEAASCREGLGRIMVNGRRFFDYFGPILTREDVLKPLEVTDQLGYFDVRVNVTGGGFSGQAQAIRHGLSKALQAWDPENRPALKASGFLTRDSRVVERKKPGKAKARKSFQWVKR